MRILSILSSIAFTFVFLMALTYSSFSKAPNNITYPPKNLCLKTPDAPGHHHLDEMVLKIFRNRGQVNGVYHQCPGGSGTDDTDIIVYGSIQNVSKGNLLPDSGVNVPIQISLTGSTFGEYFPSPTYGYNCWFHIVFTKTDFSEGYVVGGCPGYYDPDALPFVRVDCGKLDC